MFRGRVASLAAVLCIAFAAMPAAAQEKSGIKEGFVLPEKSAKILLIRPTIKVGAQSTGGMFEPNVDWTAS